MIDSPAEDGAEARGDTATVHPLAGEPESPLGCWLERWSHPPHFRPLVSAIPFLVARISAPAAVLAVAGEGLPSGAASAEATAVRIRRQGLRLQVGKPEPVADERALVERCHARGVASVEVARADSSLVPELQIGSWFNSSVRMRALRRCLRPLPLRGRSLRTPRLLALACDLAFWAGVRSAATPTEWERLTGSSYVCLYYHRIAGELKPGQERLDLSPQTFARHMRLLRLLRFHPLGPDELVRFHREPLATLPRRSLVVTADDAFADAVEALAPHLAHRPHVYVPTALVGGSATWAGDAPLATWEELQTLESGGAVIASHGLTHATLTELRQDLLERELTDSLRELRARLSRPPPFLAYPHGRHDGDVRDAARRAGYRLAYTTRPGRNGAGTDPYCLRRIGMKEWDLGPSLLWKLLSGEHVPRVLRELRVRRRRLAAAEEDA